MITGQNSFHFSALMSSERWLTARKRNQELKYKIDPGTGIVLDNCPQHAVLQYIFCVLLLLHLVSYALCSTTISNTDFTFTDFKLQCSVDAVQTL